MATDIQKWVEVSPYNKNKPGEPYCYNFVWAGAWFMSDTLVKDSARTICIFDSSRLQISRDGNARRKRRCHWPVRKCGNARFNKCSRIHMYRNCESNYTKTSGDRACKVAFTDVQRNPSQIKRETAVAICKTCMTINPIAVYRIVGQCVLLQPTRLR